METNGMANAEVRITHAIGLHARPCVKLTKLAKTFSSDIRLNATSKPDWIDAKSIVKVMALKAKAGETLSFQAEGEDAHSAVQELVALVERDFDE